MRRYEAELNATLSAAPIVATVQAAKEASGDVRLLYDSQLQYEHITGMPAPNFRASGIIVLAHQHGDRR